MKYEQDFRNFIKKHYKTYNLNFFYRNKTVKTSEK